VFLYGNVCSKLKEKRQNVCPVSVFTVCILFNRSALDIARAHDGIFKQKKAYRDVFLPDAIMLRDRQV